MSARFQRALLTLWHAWIAGGILVAYLTADEDTYAMHLFSGYAVLAAVAVRLLAGALAPAASPLRLPRPGVRTALAWLIHRKGRHPLFPWIALALLLGVGLAAGTGALADGTPWLEDPHEAISEASLWVIFGHVAFVSYVFGGKRLWRRWAATAKDSRCFLRSKELAP